MRCVRCGYDGNESSATICGRCGKALIDPSKQVKSEAATPVWARPKDPEPVEAPPWAQSDNAAAWQTPPEFRKSKARNEQESEPTPADRRDPADDTRKLARAKTAKDGPAGPNGPNGPRSGGTRSHAARSSAAGGPPVAAPGASGPGAAQATAARAKGPAAESPALSSSGIPASVPVPDGARPATVTVALAGVLGLGTLAMLVYGAYALFVRRALFAELASTPAAVDKAGAASSDALNGVLFALAGLLTLVAAVALGAWLRRAGHPGAFPKGWIGIAAVGVLAVVIALVLHRNGDPGPVATGYIVLGVGGLLLAGAMGWAAALVLRSDPGAGA